MGLAAVNTSRYPRGNGPRSVPDIRRTRPLPKPLPHERRAPRGPIGNENFPAPNVRRAAITTILREGLALTRIARAASPVSMVAGVVLDELIQGQLDALMVPTSLEGFKVPSNWVQRTYCPKYPGGISGVGAWVYTSGIPPLTLPCIQNQSTTKFNTFEEAMPRTNVGYGRKNGTGVTSERVNFSHSWSAVGSPVAPYPELVPLPMPMPLPWPRIAPQPDPDLWPMELPYPVTNPVLRPWPGLGARTAAGPTMRGGNRGNRAPGDKRKARKNRDDLEEQRKPGRYVKEVKGTGEAMVLQLGVAKVKVGAWGGIGQIPGRTTGTASELLDLVTSLFGALPEDIRRQYGTSPDDMLVALYRFPNEIDLNIAAKNVLLNMLEDGLVGRGIGKMERNLGKPGLATLISMPGNTLGQTPGVEGTIAITIEYGIDR